MTIARLRQLLNPSTITIILPTSIKLYDLEQREYIVSVARKNIRSSMMMKYTSSIFIYSLLLCDNKPQQFHFCCRRIFIVVDRLSVVVDRYFTASTEICTSTFNFFCRRRRNYQANLNRKSVKDGRKTIILRSIICITSTDKLRRYDRLIAGHRQIRLWSSTVGCLHVLLHPLYPTIIFKKTTTCYFGTRNFEFFRVLLRNHKTYLHIELDFK